MNNQEIWLEDSTAEVNQQPPVLSIVVPALNEELTIGEFVQWCLQGLSAADIHGEIIIVDSSSDDTARLALQSGAKVLHVPKRGLGRAYIDALPFVQGKWLILGDCDLTYDFRELIPFIEKFNSGFDFIMGSRMAGFIEPGSMPPLHRFFGTPLTTWILNQMFSTHYSDIHCGMRGITYDAMKKMSLQSQGWEYASEMVLKAAQLKLKIAEVPVKFYKDRDGRLSHHKRSGFLSPWLAGWVNLKAMFLYGSNALMIKPGLCFLFLGLLLSLPQFISGKVWQLGSVHFALSWMLLGVCLSVSGLQALCLGLLSLSINDLTGKSIARFSQIFSYNRSVLTCFLVMGAGIVFCFPLLNHYLHDGLKLQSVTSQQDLFYAVGGIMLFLLGFTFFSFTLILHSLCIKNKNPSSLM